MGFDWSGAKGAILQNAMSTFGEAVEYRPTAGSPYPLQAIFDESYQEVDPDTGAVVSTSQPMLGVQLARLAAPPAEDDRVFARGSVYRVESIDPDGQGGASLRLHKLS